MSETGHYMTLLRVNHCSQHITAAAARYHLLPDMIAAAKAKGRWGRVSDLIIERQTLETRHGFTDTEGTL